MSNKIGVFIWASSCTMPSKTTQKWAKLLPGIDCTNNNSLQRKNDESDTFAYPSSHSLMYALRPGS